MKTALLLLRLAIVLPLTVVGALIIALGIAALLYVSITVLMLRAIVQMLLQLAVNALPRA